MNGPPPVGVAARSPRKGSLQEHGRLTFFLLLFGAVVIEGVILWLTSLMSLPEFFPGKDGISLDFVKMLGPDWQRNTALQFVAFVLLFLAFGLALWLLHPRQARRHPGTHPILGERIRVALVFVPPVLWSVTAAFMYPPYAVDLFHNLADSRLLWIYHLNPMVVAPIARPFLIGTSYADLPSAYGPLWYLLTFPASIFQPGNYLSSIVILKLWMGAFYIATGAMIYLIVHLDRRPVALFAATLYLWNPFVIMRDLGDGHNDVVMFFFVLVALYCLAEKEWLPVFPALMLSGLIKYASLLLGPVILFYVLSLPATLRRRALPRLLAGGGVAALLTLIVFVPFWVGPRTLQALRGEGNLSITSTPLLVQIYITDPLFGARGPELSRLWTRVLFLGPFCWLLLRVRPSTRSLYGASYQALWLFIVIAVAWFRPWYLLWVVTIGALLPSGWFLAVTLTISWFGMFPDIVEQYRIYVPWLESDIHRLYLAPILVVFLPPVLVWTAGIAWTRSWFFSAGKRTALDDRQTAPAVAGD